MAGKTLVNGTAYKISGGKALVNGTSYKIFKGKTLVNGTSYTIPFGIPYPATFTTATANVTFGSVGYAAYGNGYFVVSVSSKNYIWRSADGINWTKVTFTTGSVVGQVALIFANNQFLLVCYDGSGVYSYMSSNGASWSKGGVLSGASSLSSRDAIAYGAGYYVCWAGTKIMRTTTGDAWAESANPGSGSNNSAIEYADGKFIALINSVQWTATDPRSFVSSTVSTISAYRGGFLFYQNGKFISPGNNTSTGKRYAITSSDSGQSWSQVNKTSIYLYGVDVIDNVSYFTTDTGTKIYSSLDGYNLTEIDLGVSAAWRCVCHSDDKILIISEGNQVAYSL